MSEAKTKTDYFFAFCGLIAFVFTIPAMLAGIWVDGRWWPTSFLLMILGVLCLVISHYLDRKWAQEGRTK